MTRQPKPPHLRRHPRSVSLTPFEVEFLTAYGHGNLSAGVQAATRVCWKLQSEAAEMKARSTARSTARSIET